MTEAQSRGDGSADGSSVGCCVRRAQRRRTGAQRRRKGEGKKRAALRPTGRDETKQPKAGQEAARRARGDVGHYRWCTSVYCEGDTGERGGRREKEKRQRGFTQKVENFQVSLHCLSSSLSSLLLSLSLSLTHTHTHIYIYTHTNTRTQSGGLSHDASAVECLWTSVLHRRQPVPLSMSLSPVSLSLPSRVPDFHSFPAPSPLLSPLSLCFSSACAHRRPTFALAVGAVLVLRLLQHLHQDGRVELILLLLVARRSRRHRGREQERERGGEREKEWRRTEAAKRQQPN